MTGKVNFDGSFTFLSWVNVGIGWEHVVGLQDSTLFFYGLIPYANAARVSYVDRNGQHQIRGSVTVPPPPGGYMWSHVVATRYSQLFFYDRQEGSGAVGICNYNGSLFTLQRSFGPNFFYPGAAQCEGSSGDTGSGRVFINDWYGLGSFYSIDRNAGLSLISSEYGYDPNSLVTMP